MVEGLAPGGDRQHEGPIRQQPGHGRGRGKDLAQPVRESQERVCRAEAQRAEPHAEA